MPTKPGEYFLADEFRVQPRLKDNILEFLSGFLESVDHEFCGTIGIMNISSSMVYIDKLTRLGYCTEQGIIATAAFFPFIKTNGCALSVSFCPLH